MKACRLLALALDRLGVLGGARGLALRKRQIGVDPLLGCRVPAAQLRSHTHAGARNDRLDGLCGPLSLLPRAGVEKEFMTVEGHDHPLPSGVLHVVLELALAQGLTEAGRGGGCGAGDLDSPVVVHHVPFLRLVTAHSVRIGGIWRLTGPEGISVDDGLGPSIAGVP